jgi:hypothetical protein
MLRPTALLPIVATVPQDCFSDCGTCCCGFWWCVRGDGSAGLAWVSASCTFTDSQPGSALSAEGVTLTGLPSPHPRPSHSGPCLFGENSSDLGDGSCFLNCCLYYVLSLFCLHCCLAGPKRGRLRANHGLEEAPCGDCCTHCWCGVSAAGPAPHTHSLQP